jgi:hypothetical protein
MLERGTVTHGGCWIAQMSKPPEPSSVAGHAPVTKPTAPTLKTRDDAVPAAETIALSNAVGALSGTDAVPLTEFADELHFTRKMEARKQAFSERVADRILSLFKVSVLSTVTLSAALAAVDAWFIGAGWIEPAERLVTSGVIMSIIGASIVQVGAASAAIVYSVFKQSPRVSGGSGD